MSATELTAAPAKSFELDPRMAMAVLGFISGLPYVVFTGTINVWLVEYEITTKSIGVFALVALPYAFKFLWSPTISAVRAPFVGLLAHIGWVRYAAIGLFVALLLLMGLTSQFALGGLQQVFTVGLCLSAILLALTMRTGQLRSWILLCLAVIAGTLLALPSLDPTNSLGLIAVLALLCVFASATQDIAIGGWRIGIAKDDQQLNTLTAIEQFTYRISAFFGAAVAIVIAQNFGWTVTWWLIAGIVTVCFALVFFVPDVIQEGSAEGGTRHIHLGGSLTAAQRRQFLLPLIVIWVVSLLIVFGFMFYVLAIAPETSTRTFTRWGAPYIAAACVFAPVIAAAMILRHAGESLGQEAKIAGPFDTLYITLLEPFVDLVSRLKWGLLGFLFLVLFYRYADGVWGSLAYPFYMGKPEVNGGLGYSYAEVAAASKVFGVIMTSAGVAIGGVLLATIGRMPSLVIGAVLAAATNLLYADLASGGDFANVVIAFTHMDVLFPPINWLVNLLSSEGDVVVGNALGRLMLVIAGENLAVGLASVVYVAYLSSVVNKRYAAVQFALLASLSILISTLTKPILGELADERGFAYVFILTAFLGLLGVAASIIEWFRVRSITPPPAPESLEAHKN